MLICRSEDIGNRQQGTARLERVADSYAADLLLPRYLFIPISRQYDEASFRTVRELGNLFDTSVAATAKVMGALRSGGMRRGHPLRAPAFTENSAALSSSFR